MDSEPAKYVVGRIRQALAEDSRTNILDVQISVRGTKVYLLGQVDSALLRKAVEAVTREVLPHDFGLVNELWIANYAVPPETESVP